ncbi:MAG: Gfo/Idh/MocA family oxidoreductase [Candidatus Bathyarchaeia archaeon]
MKLRKAFRVGLVGVAHNHVWHILDMLQESGLGVLVAASVEEKPALETRRKKLREKYGLEKIYNDYREMLNRENLDVIFNYTDHIQRAEVTELAASKGLHIMVEKPMAYNLKDAERMLKATEENGVKLMVNWPTMWSPVYRKAYKLIWSGSIGRVFHIRARSGHSGPKKETLADFYDFQWMGLKEAGGAYMDFCCYGVAFAMSLMGMPKCVFGTAGNFVKSFIPGYDNGILVLMYEKGTAIVEGTWSQVGRVPGDPQVFGTEGSIIIGREELIIFTENKPEGEVVKPDPLPEGERNAVEYFLTRIREDKPINGMCNPKFSRDVQEVLEAGLISSESGKAVKIPIIG